MYDNELFERKQIPMYFKHSKFSSFVRQLNFYAFRKIKEDVIRLDMDPSNEKNHWKFRHDKFQRGKPGLMVDMKRISSKQTPKPAVAASSSTSVAPTPVQNKEVQVLKKRIEDMNKSIDALTAMVEKVSLKQEEQEDKIEAGNKRKKVDNGEYPSFDEENLDLLPEPLGVSSSNLGVNDMTDDAFLDQLFVSFQEEGNAPSDAVPDETVSEHIPSSTPDNSNRPDPQLMKKLGDALELLPKVIQEMIIHRLIHAITEGHEEPMPTLASLVHEGKKLQKAIPVIPVHA